MNKPAATVILAAFTGASLFATPPCFAHGKERHDRAEEKLSHMQAMLALKEKIPEEYRIMERTPVVPDPESVARGRMLYMQHCVVCHGEKGRGDGPAAAALSTRPADFLNLDHSAIYGPGEKYWIIGNGSGQTGMPAFAQIEPKDRWHLVNFLLALQAEKGRKSSPEHSH